MEEKPNKRIVIDDEEFFIENMSEESEYPLDNFFNVNQVDETQHVNVPETQTITYDEKDNDLDRELSEITMLAKRTFDQQQKVAMTVEPKFRAELLGVANNMLTTALMAISKKVDMKKHKDKLVKPKLTIGNSETTNIIVADRNEILKQMRGDK